MNGKLLALFLGLLMAFQMNGQGVVAVNDTRKVEEKTVRDVGKGTDGYFITPEGDATISSRAYANNTKLVYVIVSDSVKTIEDEAFAGCVNLRYVFLPKSVTSFGKNVFKGCPRFYWKEGTIVQGMTVACEKGISTEVFDQLYDQELQIDMVVRDAPPISGGPITRYPQVGRPWGFPLGDLEGTWTQVLYREQVTVLAFQT